MLLKWPIRNKLLLGLGLLLVIVGLLAWGGIHGLYAYRALVKSLSRRVHELPLAAELSQRVSDLRVTLADVRSQHDWQAEGHFSSPVGAQLLREEFLTNLAAVEQALDRYGDRLSEDSIWPTEIGNAQHERETVAELTSGLKRLHSAYKVEDWLLDEVQIGRLNSEVENLHVLAAQLPGHLFAGINEFTEEARTQYRTLIVLTWATALTTALMLAVLVKLFYDWVFRPLRILIKGSRKVASGQFQYRIRLDTQDEMSELAAAMNDMTARFAAIRDDLDSQVQERTRQVIRSEQLASVGFLAAGVAHEINNPLASIAMCAESLEGRLEELLPAAGDDAALVRNYLRMIQSEAFRCKGITEKLLDFSRLGESRRQPVELRALAQDVVEMIGHLGKYHGKRVVFEPGPECTVLANNQELKQVVLNLIVNALDAIAPEGQVTIRLTKRGAETELQVRDDGHGFTNEVRAHLFEPFFTRKKQGQGTGLGLSIAYRIVSEHGGTLEADSPGPGLGSTFSVHLPATTVEREENNHRYAQAA